MQINALLPLLALLAVPLTEAKSHRDVLGKRNDHHARAAAKVAHNIERREALAQTNPRALSDKPIRTVKKRGSQKCRPRGGQFSASAVSAVSTASSASSASASAVASSVAVVPSAAASPSPSPAPASSEAAAPSPAAPSVSQRKSSVGRRFRLGKEEKNRWRRIGDDSDKPELALTTCSPLPPPHLPLPALAEAPPEATFLVLQQAERPVLRVKKPSPLSPPTSLGSGVSTQYVSMFLR